MKDSGYNEEMRKEVVKAGMTGYYNMVEKEITGVRRVNRTVTEGKRDRDIRKVVGSSNWFREKGPNPEDTDETVKRTETTSKRNAKPAPAQNEESIFERKS